MSAIATWLVALTAASAATVPYVFLGPLPVWTLFGSTALFWSFATGRGFQFARTSGFTSIALAWFATVIVTLSLDILGAQDRDVISGAGLSLATLVAVVGIINLSSGTDRHLVMAALASIALGQGVLCILQFLGVDWAWRFWELIRDLAPSLVKVDDETVQLAPYYNFDSYGRARGTHVFIHVFTGIQTALVAALALLSLSPPTSIRSKRTLLIFLRVSTVVGAIGLALTFSRSAVLGLGLALLLSLAMTKQARAVALTLVALALIVITLRLLGIEQAAQLSRLFIFDPEQTTNRARIELAQYAIETFNQSPLLGASALRGRINDLQLPIHSVPLRYLNDYGLVGLALYSAVFSALALAFLHRVRHGSLNVRPWAVAGLCALVAVAADSWTHSSGLLKGDIFHGVLLATLLGAMAAAEKEEKASSARPRQSGSRMPASWAESER